MATAITEADVKDGFDTSLSSDQIDLAIALVDQADACLDANSVPATIQKALKVYGARHILTLQANSGRGNVTSESAPSGASRSYGRWQGAGGSPYWGLLGQLDKYGCVTAVLENSAKLSIRSIGRSCT